MKKKTDLIGDWSFQEPAKKQPRLSDGQARQQRELKQKQELIRLVGMHMQNCQTCQVYGSSRCAGLKKVQDDFNGK